MRFAKAMPLTEAQERGPVLRRAVTAARADADIGQALLRVLRPWY
jgi:hypothetical protein